MDEWVYRLQKSYRTIPKRNNVGWVERTVCVRETQQTWVRPNKPGQATKNLDHNPIILDLVKLVNDFLLGFKRSKCWVSPAQPNKQLTPDLSLRSQFPAKRGWPKQSPTGFGWV